jgi:hypothetical protein
LIIANSAPCTNGTAIAKSRYVSAGKPGRLVAASSPPVLMATSSSGKISGGTTMAG